MGIAFDKQELNVLGHYESIRPGKDGVPKLDSPVTVKREYHAGAKWKTALLVSYGGDGRRRL